MSYLILKIRHSYRSLECNRHARFLGRSERLSRFISGLALLSLRARTYSVVDFTNSIPGLFFWVTVSGNYRICKGLDTTRRIRHCV